MLVTDFPGNDDEYPGDDELNAFATETCQGDAFEQYVGIDYAVSKYFTDAYLPSEGTWEEGDREVVCVLYVPDDDELTDSARDSEE